MAESKPTRSTSGESTSGSVTVSVIVPVGGAAPAWPRSAESLARLDPPPHEIVVVFDGPQQHPLGIAPESAIHVQLDANGGPARARNRGVEQSSGDVVFFLDSDIEVPSDLIRQVQHLFSSDGAPDAVIGSYDDAPGDPHLVSQYRNLLHHYVHQTGEEKASTFWSGCGAVRRDAFLAVEGFDESYAEPSIEDIELGARLLQAGHEIRLVKDLQVKHLKRWTFAGMVHTDLFKRAIPWTEQMLRSGGLVNDLNVKTSDRVSVALAGLLLASLPLSIFWRPARWISAALAAGILGLNAALFRFFRRVRGVAFSLGTIPLYWVYLLICGAGFAIGWLRYFVLSRTEKTDASRGGQR